MFVLQTVKRVLRLTLAVFVYRDSCFICTVSCSLKVRVLDFLASVIVLESSVVAKFFEFLDLLLFLPSFSLQCSFIMYCSAGVNCYRENEQPVWWCSRQGDIDETCCKFGWAHICSMSELRKVGCE